MKKIETLKPNEILASQRDKKIFFEALMHPNKPNAKLQKACKYYKTVIFKTK